MTWQPLLALLTLFGVATAFVVVRGRCDDRSPLFALLGRIPDALGRLTGQPGWAVATVGMSLFGLLVAGQGFYSDVAWHVADGRDKELFTPPHTAIIVGLALIAGAAAFGIVFATLERVDTRWRLGSLRVPRSTALLGILGVSALAGFPLDDVWHGVYGIDVTMWSPTHMLMICGAALSGAASWLVLREAGVPAAGGWGRALHAVTAWFALQGLLAPLGEFAFGVPQFDQVFHPLLLCLAGGLALVATRLVLGAGWALGLATVTFALDATNVLGGGALPVEPRAVGLYIGAALAVEVAAVLVGTTRVTRFAVPAGLGIATLGLATDAWWNQRAWQPWRTALVPEALALGIPLAVAATLLGCRLAGHRLPRRVGALAVAVVVVALAWPLPRPVGDVTAVVELAGRRAGRRRPPRGRARPLGGRRARPDRRLPQDAAAPPPRPPDDDRPRLPPGRPRDRRAGDPRRRPHRRLRGRDPLPPPGDQARCRVVRLGRPRPPPRRRPALARRLRPGRRRAPRPHSPPAFASTSGCTGPDPAIRSTSPATVSVQRVSARSSTSRHGSPSGT